MKRVDSRKGEEFFAMKPRTISHVAGVFLLQLYEQLFTDTEDNAFFLIWFISFTEGRPCMRGRIDLL